MDSFGWSPNLSFNAILPNRLQLGGNDGVSAVHGRDLPHNDLRCPLLPAAPATAASIGIATVVALGPKPASAVGSAEQARQPAAL